MPTIGRGDALPAWRRRRTWSYTLMRMAWMRRFIDILLSGLGLLVLSLLLLLISLAIVVFDGWPVLYIGKRVGQRHRDLKGALP